MRVVVVSGPLALPRSSVDVPLYDDAIVFSNTELKADEGKNKVKLALRGIQGLQVQL